MERRIFKKGEKENEKRVFVGEVDYIGKGEIGLKLNCYCGSKVCTGNMIAYKNMKPEDREKNKNYVLPFLLDDVKYPYIKPE